MTALCRSTDDHGERFAAGRGAQGRAMAVRAARNRPAPLFEDLVETRMNRS